MTPAEQCPGPMVWFDVDPDTDRGWTPAAVLECGTCGHLIITGNFNDVAHADAPVLRSPA